MPRQGRSRAIVVVIIALAVIAVASVIYSNRAATGSPYITEAVRRGDIIQYVRSTGELSPRSVVEVSTQISGMIIEVNTDINMTVRKGQVLALVDPFSYRQKLQQAESELASADAAETLKQLNEKRSKGLLAKGVVTEQEYDQARAELKQAIAVTKTKAAAVRNAEDELARCTITAPIDGVLIGKKISVGETVQASFTAPMLFAIAETLTQMRIVAPVSEVDIGKIQEGQAVDFNVVAIADRTFRGRVVQIRSPYTPQQNQQQQLQPTQQSSIPTFDAVIDVDNNDLALRPRFTAQVSIIVGEKKNVLLIPNSALRVKLDTSLPELQSTATSDSDDSAIVYRYSVATAAQPQGAVVHLGLSDGISTEVVNGLREGDEVVIAINEAQQPARARSSF